MHTLNICCQSNADRWRFIKTEVERCVKKAVTAVNIMCLGGSDARGMWDEFGGIMRKVWKAAGATHLESCVSPAMARLLQKTNYIAKPLYIHLRGAL